MLSETKGCLFGTHFTQLSKEFGQLILLDFLAIIFFHCELLPHKHECFLIVFKPSNHVVIRQVILLKLLDDNQNEEIKHNVTANKHKHHMVKLS
jgi:hypothetical protein